MGISECGWLKALQLRRHRVKTPVPKISCILTDKLKVTGVIPTRGVDFWLLNAYVDCPFYITDKSPIVFENRLFTLQAVTFPKDLTIDQRLRTRD